MVGAVFAEFTVNTNVSKDAFIPSLTVMVIVVVPAWLDTGVTVTVRLVPEPPKMIFEFGTRAVFEDLPDKTRFAAGVSGSETVNAIEGVGVLTVVVWSGMSLIDGGELPAGAE